MRHTQAVIDLLKFEPLIDQEIESGDVLMDSKGHYSLIGDMNTVLGWCDDCSSKREDFTHIAKDVISQIGDLKAGESSSTSKP